MFLFPSYVWKTRYQFNSDALAFSAIRSKVRAQVSAKRQVCFALGGICYLLLNPVRILYQHAKDSSAIY